MPLPPDWYAEFNQHVLVAARCVCPHCRLPSTFAVMTSHQEPPQQNFARYHCILKCNFSRCRKLIYVVTTKHVSMDAQSSSDHLEIYPAAPIGDPHGAIPASIAEDWIEAQKAFAAGAPKAAAVMCRRVLYGILLDKKCKEHPLHEGLEELAQKERLPRLVEEWANEIKEEGHDAAHPHRALQVPTQNVAEAMEYTKELLRFIYVEPYELSQRLARKAGQVSTS